MYLALATTNEPIADCTPLPSLCGVYASREDAEAYARWENQRDDFNVYYVLPASDCLVRSH